MEAGGEQALSYAVFKITKMEHSGGMTRRRRDIWNLLSLRAMCRILNGLQTVWRAAKQGYLITDIDQQTNVPGVFAAGDVSCQESQAGRDGSLQTGRLPRRH